MFTAEEMNRAVSIPDTMIRVHLNSLDNTLMKETTEQLDRLSCVVHSWEVELNVGRRR